MCGLSNRVVGGRRGTRELITGESMRPSRDTAKKGSSISSGLSGTGESGVATYRASVKVARSSNRAGSETGRWGGTDSFQIAARSSLASLLLHRNRRAINPRESANRPRKRLGGRKVATTEVGTRVGRSIDLPTVGFAPSVLILSAQPHTSGARSCQVTSPIGANEGGRQEGPPLVERKAVVKGRGRAGDTQMGRDRPA